MDESSLPVTDPKQEPGEGDVVDAFHRKQRSRLITWVAALIWTVIAVVAMAAWAPRPMDGVIAGLLLISLAVAAMILMCYSVLWLFSWIAWGAGRTVGSVARGVKRSKQA
jgi:hypothetical protein